MQLFFPECEQLLKKFLVLVPSKRTSMRSMLTAEWMNMEMETMVPHIPPNRTGDDEELLVSVRRSFQCQCRQYLTAPL